MIYNRCNKCIPSVLYSVHKKLKHSNTPSTIARDYHKHNYLLHRLVKYIFKLFIMHYFQVQISKHIHIYSSRVTH